MVDSRRRAAAADKRRAVEQQLNASRMRCKDVLPAYMSVKCDQRSPLYPYAVGAGARMTPCGLQYDAGDDGDACSNVDNEYAYVDELITPPPPPSTSRHDYTSTTANNNNATGARQSATNHVAGCLLACRQYDTTTPGDRPPRLDASNI